jgi:cystathionine beta-lyase
MQDIPAIAEVAHARGACVVADNTWATPLFFAPPHANGVDLAIEAGTKYLSGHSDLLLGLVSANADWLKRLRRVERELAIPAGPEDVYLALARIAHDGAAGCAKPNVRASRLLSG